VKPAARSSAIATYLTRPVIPYVTEGVDPHANLIAQASIIFIGGGELADLPQLLKKLGEPLLAERPVLLHIDLLNGLANDESGLRYIATHERIDGSSPSAITWRHWRASWPNVGRAIVSCRMAEPSSAALA
jgi:hypothetical protein